MKRIDICENLDKVHYPKKTDVMAAYPECTISDCGDSWHVVGYFHVDDDGVYIIPRDEQELLDLVLHGAQQELLDLD